jgi:DNA invertase Pin-like site-specific DNA recombinase
LHASSPARAGPDRCSSASNPRRSKIIEPAKASSRRCAIYTRKSSEEGLEQDFNSLHAQREACEAFIKSQAGEGWRLLKTAYDDGGLSGGTMERPALQRLLADIDQGLIEVVVVYKVDRLTRSLADFAKMVEVFDAHGVSFVAVTQQFNTTTSMGRLTLNVLLSFAQFEREVTGERIRDKIAASKRKGIWMGGFVPLGYDVCDRRIVIDEPEAETVRYIFRQYVELGCVRLLKEDLDRHGVVSKRRTAKSGIESGGHSFSRGALYALLSNPIYVGEIRHKNLRHPGQHQAIVDQAVWERTQQQLQEHRVRPKSHGASFEKSPLSGRLVDENGDGLTPSHARKGERRYRYYVSRNFPAQGLAPSRAGWRLPAREIEARVAAAVGEMLGDESAVLEAAQKTDISSSQLDRVLHAARTWCHRLQSESEQAAAIAELVDRVELRSDGIRVSLKLAVPEAEKSRARLPDQVALARSFPMQLKRRGVELRLIVGDHNRSAAMVDLSLLKAVARAHRWFDELSTGRARSLAVIAACEGLAVRYVGRLIRLAFLAPDIVESIVDGRQPATLTTEALTRRIELPLSRCSQKTALNVE